MFTDEMMDVIDQINRRINRLSTKLTDGWKVDVNIYPYYGLISLRFYKFKPGNFEVLKYKSVDARMSDPESWNRLIQLLEEMEERYAG